MSNKLLLSLSPEEVDHVKIAIDKQIRLLTLKLQNGYFNKQRPIVQEQLKTLKGVYNRL